MPASFPPPYSIRISKRARKAGLRIASEVGLEVVLPENLRRTNVPALIDRHRAWIERHYTRIMQPSINPELLQDGFFIAGGTVFMSFSPTPLAQETLHQLARQLLPGVITPRIIHQRPIERDSFPGFTGFPDFPATPATSTRLDSPNNQNNSNSSTKSTTLSSTGISSNEGIPNSSHSSHSPDSPSSPNFPDSPDSPTSQNSLNFLDSLDSTNTTETLSAAPCPARLSQALRQWTLAEADRVFRPQLAELLDREGLRINRCVFKLQKTRWGSCSSKRNININANILFLPEQLARYILVHELCHLYHLNHSDKFWKKVFELEPQALRLDKSLRHAKKYLPWHNLP